jgi:hypothetical protein
MERDQLVASERAKRVWCRAEQHLLSLGLGVHGSWVEFVVDTARGALERNRLVGAERS